MSSNPKRKSIKPATADSAAVRRLNNFEHMRHRPERDLGDITTKRLKKWTYDEAAGSAVFRKTNHNHGLFNLVREIGSNCVDNKWRSDEHNIPMKCIDIAVDKTTGMISFTNDGFPIPVRKQKWVHTDERTNHTDEYEAYPAEEYFGATGTSTNYDDDASKERFSSGKFGLGAKAANAFSTFFEIDHASAQDKKQFTQSYTTSWTGGKLADLKFDQVKTEPKIKPYSRTTSFTRISFVPDYAYFHYPSGAVDVEPDQPKKKRTRKTTKKGKEEAEDEDADEDEDAEESEPTRAHTSTSTSASRVRDGIDQDFIDQIHLYAYEIAMLTGLKVTFNGKAITIKDLDKYSKLYYPSAKRISFISPLTGDECVIVETGQDDNSADTLQAVSFVNGINTVEGGVHVNAWRDAVFRKLMRTFNDKFAKDQPKSKDPISVKGSNLYPYFVAFVRCKVNQPSYSTQHKSVFTGVGPNRDKYIISNKQTDQEWKHTLETSVNKMMKWDFVEHIKSKLLGTIIEKIDKARTFRAHEHPNLIDANWADDRDLSKKRQTKVFLCEGLSARTLIERARSGTPGYSDIYAAFALRGKVINHEGHSLSKFNDNKEISAIKTMLGLRSGVDYSIRANRDTLRYGAASILTDADPDGVHISGLILNALMHIAPTLFLPIHDDVGAPYFMERKNTPVVMATVKRDDGDADATADTDTEPPAKSKSKKKTTTQLFFYSVEDFRNFMNTTTRRLVGDPKYYKGLGSIAPTDNKIIFDQNTTVYLTSTGDEKEQEIIKLGFSKQKDYVQRRKKWMTNKLRPWDAEEDDKHHPDTHTDQTITGDMSLATFIDTQLINYHTMSLERAIPNLMDGFKDSTRKIMFTFLVCNYIKATETEAVLGRCKDKTLYHHGIDSLNGAICIMSQGYVFANNIPLLVPHGEMGSRPSKGENAAHQRYTSVSYDPIARYIFRPEDDPILTHKKDGDKPIEYEMFYPVVCMYLINDTEGMASGFSCKNPGHNPEDIAAWQMMWLDDRDAALAAQPPRPWYRGFKGTLETECDEDGNPIRFTTTGCLAPSDNKKFPKHLGWWHISELPYAASINDYEIELNAMKYEDKEKDVPKRLSAVEVHHPNSNAVGFYIKAMPTFTPAINEDNNIPKLTHSYSMKNMVSIDERGYPTCRNTRDILDVFCTRRLAVYAQRRKYWINKYKRDLVVAKNRVMFIRAVTNKEIDFTLDEDIVEAKMEEMGFDKLSLKATSETDEHANVHDDDDDSSPLSYDYLFSMNGKSMLKKSRADAIEASMEALKDKLANLKATTPTEMWKKDIEEFLVEYGKFLKRRPVEAM